MSPKAHLFVTLCHWAMVIAIVLSLLSGMRIGWGYMESPLGGDTGVWSNILSAIAPKGTLLGINLIQLHVILAYFMLAVMLIYVIYLFRSRASKRLRLTSRDVQKLQDGLAKKNFWRNKSALWSANLIVYWISFVFILLLFGTGTLMYFLEWPALNTAPSQWFGGYSTLRLLHALVAYLFIPYTILHIVLQWFFGRFWSIFKARWYLPHVRAGLLGFVCSVSVGGIYAWSDAPMTLTVVHINDGLAVPVLDGDANDPVWNHAAARTIRTVKGVNNLESHVDVDVKALYDDEHVYFMFRWKDHDVSYKRFPLRKTIDGWEVLQTAFERADENLYYEDKLSVYFTHVPNGSCATTCHLGVGPHAEAGEKHGLHYTQGEIGDVWHWKSVRTNHMAGPDEPGYMDDQYFGPPVPLPSKKGERYTGGYHADPKTGGGYRYNFVKVAPNNSLNQTLVHPIKLPRSLDIAPDSNPATSEEGVTWWILESEGTPYDERLDTFSVGTLIPNIIIEPFKGDRADVRAKAKWRDGYWTLEVKRALDTKSKFDVPFKIDEPIYMSVAAYNRTQTRHSEHIRPLKLVLQKAAVSTAGTN